MHSMTQTRRRFLATTAVAGASVPLAAHATERATGSDEFRFEIERTEDEWRSMLTNAQYEVLRNGATEPPEYSPLWEETADGTYHCRGCELHAYDSRWKTILDKGWLFFGHSVPNAALTGIDQNPGAEGMVGTIDNTTIEAHCRRCGSHWGHILYVEGRVLHCINGTALEFRAA